MTETEWSLEELLCLLVDERVGSVSATNEESGDMDARGTNSMVTALSVRGTDVRGTDVRGTDVRGTDVRGTETSAGTKTS